MNNTVFYSLIMLIAGIGIPTMAALNSGLGSKLQSPALASAILLTVGLLIALVYLFVTEGMPATLYQNGTPWYYYSGGFFVMFYIISITWIAPRFGISNAVAFVLLGQLIAMSTIDHFGLFGTQTYSIDLKRILGLVFMTIGVFLVLAKKNVV